MNKIQIWALLSIIGFTLASLVTNAKEQKMSILQQKPVFELELNVFGSATIIYVNGVGAFTDLSSDGQISTILPVNHWMRSGKNIITMDVLPDKPGMDLNKNAKLEIKLLVKDHNDPKKSFTVVTISYQGKMVEVGSPTIASSQSGKFNSQNNFYPDDKGDVEVFDIIKTDAKAYKGGLVFSREINIPNSLPEWAFFSSDNLMDTDSMSDEDYYKQIDILLAEYIKVEKAIATRNIDSVMPMFEERNKEFDAAFYAEPGTFKERIRSSLSEAANDNNLELLYLSQKKVNFLNEENRKLSKLVRNGSKSAIVLNFKSFPGATRFDLIFRYKDGKWILTR